jgi:membrane protein DedA with SNARE-associated domain
MNLPLFVSTYGYTALTIGTFFEGESIMLLGGAAARAGFLNFEKVILFGSLGVFCSDQFCFYLGRFWGQRILQYFPSLNSRFHRTFNILFRHPHWLIIGFQFIPGTSTVTPIALGMSNVNAFRFLVLDFIGLALWTFVFASSGYLGCSILEYITHSLL